MQLKLTDKEAVAMKHALDKYLKELQGSGNEKGVVIERETVEGLLNRIENSVSQAPGI